MMCGLTIKAQEKPDTTLNRPTSKDSSALLKQTAVKDSILKKNKKDSFALNQSSSALPSPVKYHARDSIVFDLEKKMAYLYGKATLDYTDINLKADSININFDKNEIWAEGRKDSTGKKVGEPYFKEGGDETYSTKLGYSFKTKKGIVYNVRMKQGEGRVLGKTVKTIRTIDKGKNKDVVYIEDAKYTTCDLQHPHFYIMAHKMKVMPKDKIITGPARMYIEDVPLPIILPFGFFPANSRKTSGIIIPTYGESATQGFALRNGGYYYGGSDYFDAALTGDIYTGGTFKLNLASRYALRYKYRGDFSLSFANNQNGYRETPSYNVQRNYFINWNHHQDDKANPGTSFSASVNAGSSNYLSRNSYNVAAITTQNLSSSISYSKRWAGTPFSLSAALRHSQEIAKKSIDFTLPDVNFGMSRINPFRPKSAIVHKWYHDVNISYNLNIKNQLHTSDSTIGQDLKKLKFASGGVQSIPIGTSIKLMRYFTFNPSVTYTGYLYRQKYNEHYDIPTKKLKIDTTDGFYAAHEYRADASLSTIIFGKFNFRKGKIVGIQHVITPSITASYRPDFSENKFGYYGLAHLDSTPKYSKFSRYANTVIGTPGAGKTGSLSYSIQNNIEMKVKSGKDTAHPTKKIKLLESFGISGGYNFLADSMKLSDIHVSARTTLFERLNVQGDGTFTPYYDGPNGRVKDLEINRDGKLGHFSSASGNMSFNFNKAAAKKPPTGRLMPLYDPYLGWYYHDNPYANFDVPWNIAFNYAITYNYVDVPTAKAYFYTHKNLYTQTISMNGSIVLTERWKITYNTGYDFVSKNYTLTKLTFARDLHCWQMSFDWTPFGAYKSYFFNIRVKASTLQDLKFEKRKDNFDAQ